MRRMSLEAEHNRGSTKLHLIGGFIWGVAFTLVAVMLLHGIASPGTAAESSSMSQTPSSGTFGSVEKFLPSEFNTSNNSGLSSFDFDGDSFDVEAKMDGLSVALSNIGNTSKTQSIEFTSSSLDNSSLSHASTGLCVIGLDESNPSGVTFDTDSTENSVNVSINDSSEDSTTQEPSSDLAEECSRHLSEGDLSR